MIYKIKATNKHNGEIIEFDLEGNAVEDFVILMKNLKKQLIYKKYEIIK